MIKEETNSNRKTWFRTITTRYQLELSVSNDFKVVYGSIRPLEIDGEVVITEAELCSVFSEAGVDGEYLVDNVDFLIDTVNKNLEANNIALIRAIEPINGIDAHLHFYIKPQSVNYQFDNELSSSLQADYHNLNLFENVKKDDLIAELRPATKGASGMNVVKELMFGVPGTSLNYNITYGVNVRIEESDNCTKYYALEDGLVTFSNNHLDVSDTYVIKQDVDYRIGNIDFSGHVQIVGNVLNGFNIRGAKSINIRGNVGSCRLESDGDITIYGMAADLEDAQGEIISHNGNIIARYLDGVKINCAGDLIVKNEIFNCIAEVEGQVVATPSTIIGGKIQALRGIEAANIGSDRSSAKTILICGCSAKINRRIKEIEAEVVATNAKVERIANSIQPILRNPDIIENLPQHNQVTVRDLVRNYEKLLNQLENCRKEITKLRSSEISNSIPRINIGKKLEKDTTIAFGYNPAVTIDRTIKSRNTLEYNGEEANVRILNYMKLI
ncbi:FapA family protein [Lentisphaerota bacterium WC36G]|nr:FapA family protein [Lentisphaerae bacterium WC36]